MREIIGCQYVDIVGQDGKPVKGWKLFLQYTDDNVTGVGCESVWVREGLYPPDFNPCPGNFIYVLRNAKGRVQGVIACPAA